MKSKLFFSCGRRMWIWECNVRTVLELNHSITLTVNHDYFLECKTELKLYTPVTNVEISNNFRCKFDWMAIKICKNMSCTLQCYL